MILNATHDVPNQNIEQIAANLVNGLVKIVSPINGPYIVFLWSRNIAECRSKFEEKVSSCEDLKCKPISIVGLGKETCFYHSEEGYVAKDDASHIINNAIETEIKGIDALKVLFNWENSNNKASVSVIKSICDIPQIDSSSWNMHMKRRLVKMAKAYMGENLDEKPETVAEGAYYCLNKIFTDVAGAQVFQYKENVKEIDYLRFIDGIVGEICDQEEKDGKTYIISRTEEAPYYHLYENNIETYTHRDLGKIYRRYGADIDRVSKRIVMGNAMINTLLNVRTYETDKNRPGNVYELSLEDFNEIVPELKVDDEEKKQEIKGIMLEVSPLCDYSQNKRKRVRLVPGFLIPSSIKWGNDAIKAESCKYSFIKPIVYNNEVCYLYLDYRYLFAKQESYLEGKSVILALGDELLKSIVEKMSNQISRSGIVELVIDSWCSNQLIVEDAAVAENVEQTS